MEGLDLAKLKVLFGNKAEIKFSNEHIFVLNDSHTYRVFDKDYNQIHDYGYCEKHDDDYLIVREDKSQAYSWNCGLMDTKGNLVVNLDYEGIREVRNGYVIVRKNSKYGCLRISDNVLVVDCLYSRMKFVSDNALAVKTWHKSLKEIEEESYYAVIDVNNNLLLDFLYIEVDGLSKSHFCFKSVWAYGIYNSINNTKTDFIFKNIKRVDNKFCIADYNNISCILNLDEMELNDTYDIDRVICFGKYYCIRDKHASYGVLDENLNMVVDVQYTSYHVNEGRLYLTGYDRNETVILLLDGKKRVLTGLKDSEIVDGVFVLHDKKSNQSSIVESKNYNKVINETYERIRVLNESKGLFMCVKNSKVYICSKKSKLCNEGWDGVQVLSFSDDMYKLNLNGKWAIASIKNDSIKLLTDFKYVRICSFNNKHNVYTVEIEPDKFVLLNDNFKQISKGYSYMYMAQELNDYYVVHSLGAEKLRGMIDYKGKEIIPVEFLKLEVDTYSNTAKGLLKSFRWKNFRIV